MKHAGQLLLLTLLTEVDIILLYQLPDISMCSESFTRIRFKDLKKIPDLT